MLKHQLRKSAAEIHSRVLSHPVLAPLASHKVSSEDYLNALSALHGFYAPMEALLAGTPDLSYRSSRAKIIANDIRKLAGDGAARYLAPRATDLPGWTGGDRLLGACCILDEAIFAGRPAAANIGRRFKLTPRDGAGFLGSWGFDAIGEWRHLMEIMEKRASDELAELRMIDGAISTLAALERWLDAFHGQAADHAAAA